MCAICTGMSMSRRGALFGLVASAGLAACATNPETGRSQLLLVDDSQLSQMALQAWAQQRQQTPQWRNGAAQARLERVGRRIAVAANRPNDPWEFVLFDQPDLNAFVLPGGKVGFYRGLMELAQNDDQIAVVLGHEVGHVTGRHAAERYSNQIAQNAAMQIAGSYTNNQLALAALGLGAQIGIALPFSRDQESEADMLGINYMRAAGFDVRQAVPFWQLMNQRNSGARPPEFLSTHPDPDNRIARLRGYINERGWGPA